MMPVLHADETVVPSSQGTEMWKMERIRKVKSIFSLSYNNVIETENLKDE
jgi:hypothetical protein